MTDQTERADGNELYFTRKTKRYARIGDTLRVVTEGATITITLGDFTRVGVVVTEPNVVVRKSVRKRAQATENTEPVTEPAPAVVKPAPAKPRARKVATVVKPAPAK